MPKRWLVPIVVALLAVLALAPARASADGDPASDVLLGNNVFYPYTPPVSGPLQKTLNAETAAAKRAGFPIKVALIASPVDLGVIPGLFGKPQKYANFLDQEISFRGKQPLLVVMPTGYGVQGLSPRASAAVASLPKPTGTRSNDLARAAIAAVARLSARAGHPISGVSGASSSSSTTTMIVIVLAVIALLTAAVLATVTLRRRRGNANVA